MASISVQELGLQSNVEIVLPGRKMSARVGYIISSAIGMVLVKTLSATVHPLAQHFFSRGSFFRLVRVHCIFDICIVERGKLHIRHSGAI